MKPKVLLLLVFCGGVAIASGVAARAALAQSNDPFGERGNFYSGGSAKSPFADPLVEGERPETEFFPTTNKLPIFAPKAEPAVKKPGEQGQAESQTNTEQNKQPSAGDATKNASAEKPKDPRAEILKKYGDPAEETPILAVDNAPKPFKGMMEALQGKDEQLALQYAKQWARYMNNMQERNARISSLMQHAMKREHMLEDGQEWRGAPLYNEHKKLYEQELQAVAEARKALGESGELEALRHDPKAQQQAIDRFAQAMIAKGRIDIARAKAGIGTNDTQDKQLKPVDNVFNKPWFPGVDQSGATGGSGGRTSGEVR